MTENDKTQNQGLVITPDVLQKMISSAVESAVRAVKAPTEQEQKKIDAENAEVKKRQDERLQMAASIKEDMERKKQTQKFCPHEHSDGNSHCVYVQEKVGPGYILCQLNQCIIRPGEASKNYKGTVIYDTALFNKLWHRLSSSGGDIIG